MTYELITNLNSRNYTPGANVAATFGRPRTIDSITIHWWGLPEWGDTFDGVCNFLCTNTKPTSAHEVIEAGRVAVLVNHGDASWAAGNAVGNATSIHLECRPRASEEDYATVAERVRDLRAMYGDLPLIPHRDWQATQCPGVWDLAKIDALARNMGGAASILPAGLTKQEEEIVPNQNDRVFDAIDGSKVTLNELLNSIDRKSTAALQAVSSILATRIPDPTDPKKSYSIADYIVGGATNAKYAAGNSGAAMQNTSPEALAKAVQEGAATVSAKDVADRLTIGIKE